MMSPVYGGETEDKHVSTGKVQRTKTVELVLNVCVSEMEVYFSTVSSLGLEVEWTWIGG